MNGFLEKEYLMDVALGFRQNIQKKFSASKFEKGTYKEETDCLEKKQLFKTA